MDNVFDYDNLILNEKIFGLEIIDGKVRVLEIKGTGSKYTVSGFGEARMNQASIQDGIIINSEDVANAIREARENALPNKIKRRFASVMLPDSKIFIRIVRFPSKMNKDEIREAVEWKAKDLIAMPLDKVYWDWHRISQEEGANEVEVVISAVERECADSYTTTLKLLNVTPLFYDISGNAASRFLFQNKFPQKKALLVRIDQDSVTLSLYLNGGVRYQKIVKDVIKGGCGVLVEYAASQLRLEAEKAKTMIFSPDKLNEEQKLLLKEFFEAKFDHWYAEIDQILDYFYQTVYSKTKSQVMTQPVKDEEERKAPETVQKEKVEEKSESRIVKPAKVEGEQKVEAKPLKQVTVDGKEDIEIYFYGPGARMVYLENFFIQKGLNVKTELSSGVDISSIKEYVSKEGLHANLVLLGMSLRNIGIFRELRDINLIPKKIKSKYLQISVYSSLYQYLKIIFWNTYIIGVILVFAFLLSLVYKNSAESELESVQNISESPANIQMRERIVDLNDTALRLNALLDTQLDWDTFYEKISGIRGNGILYNNILITEDEETWKGVAGENAGTSQKNVFYLVISGRSDTRDDLQRFAFNLQNQKFISDVRMPFSNFETNRNIDFTIYAYVHKQNLVKNQEEKQSNE